jgi:hypothetical protein
MHEIGVISRHLVADDPIGVRVRLGSLDLDHLVPQDLDVQATGIGTIQRANAGAHFEIGWLVHGRPLETYCWPNLPGDRTAPKIQYRKK